MSIHYEGNGKATFHNGSTIDGNFSINIEPNGKAYLHLIFEGGFTAYVLKIPHDPVSFHGELIGTKGLVDIQKMYLTQGHFFGTNSLTFSIFNSFEINHHELKEHDNITLFRYLSNFIFGGDEVSIYERERRLDKFNIILDAKTITIKQVSNFKEIEEYFRREKNPRVTCRMEIHGENNGIELIRDLANDLQNIMSLGSGNYVTVLKEEIFLKGTLCKTLFYPLKTYPFNSGIALISSDIHSIGEYKNFITSVFPHYRANKSALALPYVIEFFNSAKIYNIMQTSFLMNCVALECLYHHYHQFKALSPTKSLAKKIEQVCSNEGILYDQDDLDLSKSRNCIAHEGDFPSGINSYQEKNRLENLLDRMILTILGYKGNNYYNVFKSKAEVL